MKRKLLTAYMGRGSSSNGLGDYDVRILTVVVVPWVLEFWFGRWA